MKSELYIFSSNRAVSTLGLGSTNESFDLNKSTNKMQQFHKFIT